MKKKNKTLLFLIILIVIVTLGFVIYENRGLFVIAMDGKTIYNIESGQTAKFFKRDGDFLVLNRDGVTAINLSGGQDFNIIKNNSNPAMSADGNYILIYDRGGRDISAYKGGSKLMEYKTEQPIKTAKINPSGYVAVVTSESGYKAKIEVIDQQGKLVYKWQLGDSYVVDVDISPDCKKLAAATLSTEENIVSGNVVFVDIDKEAITNQIKRENSVLLTVKYTNSSNLIAVGESELLGFNSKGDNTWSVNYDGRILESYHLEDDCNPVLALTGSRNNTVIEMYSKNGKKTGEYVSNYKIKSIDALDGTIAVNEQRNVILLNYNGKVRAQKSATKDVREVVLIKNRTVGVVGGATVDLLKL